MQDEMKSSAKQWALHRQASCKVQGSSGYESMPAGTLPLIGVLASPESSMQSIFILLVMPHCTLRTRPLLQKGVAAATEELSQRGAAEEVWADWEGITDAPESRQWLQQNVVISRGMVHAAAARHLAEFKQVRNMR
jgi:hypothetical protein